MKTLTRSLARMMVVTLGLCSAALSAKERPPRPPPASSCAEECSGFTKECMDVCHEHAGSGAAMCTHACRKMERECRDDCAHPPEQEER